MIKIPLVPEEYPASYNGYKFLTLIRYNNESLICIVDNIIDGEVTAYVLDLCKKEYENGSFIEENILLNAIDWFDNGHHNNMPLSIFLASKNYKYNFNKIIRRFPIDYISRMIGPKFIFPMGDPSKIKKKKKKEIPAGIEFVNITNINYYKFNSESITLP